MCIYLVYLCVWCVYMCVYGGVCVCFVCSWDTISCSPRWFQIFCVADGLELLILLPSSPVCRGYRCAPPYLIYIVPLHVTAPCSFGLSRLKQLLWGSQLLVRIPLSVFDWMTTDSFFFLPLQDILRILLHSPLSSGHERTATYVNSQQPWLSAQGLWKTKWVSIQHRVGKDSWAPPLAEVLRTVMASEEGRVCVFNQPPVNSSTPKSVWKAQLDVRSYQAILL